MTDEPKDAAETPMQRALRLKKAAQAAKPGAPGAARGAPRPSTGVAAGASRPWMKK